MKMFKDRNVSKKEIIGNILNFIVVSIIFIMCAWLFYNQSITENEFFSSDLKAHIVNSRTGKSYSLMGDIFYVILQVCDDTFFCAIALAIVIVLTMLATGYLLRYFCKTRNVYLDSNVIFSVSILNLFLCNIYVPEIFPYFYAHAIVAQPWHNSTYILMRLFSVLALLYYFKIKENYLSHISVKDWVLFTLFLTLANWSKPNFLIAFAPIMLVYLIFDFVKMRGKRMVQMIKFGMAVLCSLPICFYQTQVLWPTETEGQNGVTVTFDNLIIFVSNVECLLPILCGLLFPILVMLICIFKREKVSIFSSVWFMYILAWLEHNMLVEYGERAMHGNFSWGRKVFAYVLYLITFVECVRLYKEKKISLMVFIVLLSAYVLSIISGIYYFSRLMCGNTYIF